MAPSDSLIGPRLPAETGVCQFFLPLRFRSGEPACNGWKRINKEYHAFVVTALSGSRRKGTIRMTNLTKDIGLSLAKYNRELMHTGFYRRQNELKKLIIPKFISHMNEMQSWNRKLPEGYSA